ncbi:MAG: hypothetical protein HYT87_18575 [Nitrospirae bacterium]|nr:hypothetical protein [Nitrospirota bacterium]
MKHLLQTTLLLTVPLLMACGEDASKSTAAASGGSAVSSAATGVQEADVKDTGKIDQTLSGLSQAAYGSKEAAAGAEEITADLLETVHFGQIKSSIDPNEIASIGDDFFGMSGAPRRLLRRSLSRQTSGPCPTTVNNTSGSTVDVQIKGGCTTPEGFRVEGALLIQGTSDLTKGDAAIGMKFDGLTLTSGDAFGASFTGQGLFTSTGLTVGTSSFTAKGDLSLTTELTVLGKKGKCAIEDHASISGSSSTVQFDEKSSDICEGGDGGSQDIYSVKGSAAQNSDGTATVNATGEFVHYDEDAKQGAKGKATVELKDVVIDPAKCGEDEPAKSGKIIFTGTTPVTVEITGCGTYKVAGAATGTTVGTTSSGTTTSTTK